MNQYKFSNMLNLFQHVIHRLRDDCLAKDYELILEADLTGWLFHLLLTEPQVRPGQVHLNTRLANSRCFFDIAIGPLQSATSTRPHIQARLVVEAKLFPRIGFNKPQHRVHYIHILNDDLRKLQDLGHTCEYPVCLVVDGAGYLDGKYGGRNRLDHLVETRDRVSQKTHLLVVRLKDGNWEIRHIPPLSTGVKV